MTDWTHPRLQNVAHAISHHDFIAEEALAAFNRRKQGYPELVRLGRMKRADAEADLHAWREIARDWRWIAGGEGQPAGPDTLSTRIAALDESLSRLIAAADEAGGGFTKEQDEQCGLLCAMRWWAERERTHPAADHARFLAGILHEWRAENGHPTRGAIIAAKHAQQEKAA